MFFWARRKPLRGWIIKSFFLGTVIGLLFPPSASPASKTFSISGDSVYALGQNQGQAELRILQAFPLTVVSRSTLTFSTAYNQTPLSCRSAFGTCVQDLHTQAFTSNTAFASLPDLNICNVSTREPFPCSAAFAPGTYQLTLFINDVRFTDALFTSVVFPFTDSLAVTVTSDGLSDVPEPATTIPVVTALFLFLSAAVRKSLVRAMHPMFATSHFRSPSKRSHTRLRPELSRGR